MIRENTIPFTKMSGTGNDFIVLDNRNQNFSESDSLLFRRMCTRRTSIGADGVLLIDGDGRQSVRMRYFNRDGKEAAMCGNGARCAAYFGLYKGLVLNRSFILFSAEGQHEAEVNDRNVSITMSQPDDFQSDLKILTESEFTEGGWINIGVPHYVIFVPDVNHVDVGTLGSKYRSHEKFPHGSNVNFVQSLEKNRISVRTYERGVEDETLSCGTGCVASALVASEHFGLTSPIMVETRGGILTVQFDKEWKSIRLIGEVAVVYEGILYAP